MAIIIYMIVSIIGVMLLAASALIYGAVKDRRKRKND